jgi:hypothetical protein
MEWRLRRAAGVLIALSGLCGCAHSYIDADGNRNVIGFVHLTLPPSDKEPRAADWMRVRAIGLALSRTEIGGALELGYSDNTLAAVRNNSCVQLPQPPATLPLKGVVNAASLDF